MFPHRFARTIALFAACTLFSCAANAGDDPFADEVIDFDLGSGGTMGFDNPFTTLGSPERFTGEGIFPSVVSPFSPPFGSDEIVSIGSGGWITVRFDTAVTDDATNPFGIDLLIFGNTGFIDANWPNGVVGGIFGDDGGVIEVSQDGSDWRTVDGAVADGLFPTLGYLDSGPYDDHPGSIPSDFLRPVDPALGLDDFMGLTHAEVVALYAGSGGGAGIDIGLTGLAEISFVRVSSGSSAKFEIDAFADVAPVPAPSGLALLVLSIISRSRRSRGPLREWNAK
jgi:hypothetical protein